MEIGRNRSRNAAANMYFDCAPPGRSALRDDPYERIQN